MYALLGTKDGFVNPDKVADFTKIRTDTQKNAHDKALLPEQRQKTLAFLIGETRRQGQTGNHIQSLVRTMERMDKDTQYGKLSKELGRLWGVTQKMTLEQRAQARKGKINQKRKNQRNKMQDKKADKSVEIS